MPLLQPLSRAPAGLHIGALATGGLEQLPDALVAYEENIAPRVSLPLEGTIYAHGGGPLDSRVLKAFAKLCGTPGKIVLIPTASTAADGPEYQAKLSRAWRRRGVDEVVVMHTLSAITAAEPSFAEPLLDAGCVWIGGGAQGRLIDAYVDTPVEDALHALLLRGGAVGGYSAGAAIMTRVMIRRGNPVPVEATGFGILPEVIVDQHFLKAQREPRLLHMLRRHPSTVGYGIDEGTTLVVHGDSYRVRGRSVVRRCEYGKGCQSLGDGARGTFP